METAIDLTGWAQSVALKLTDEQWTCTIDGRPIIWSNFEPLSERARAALLAYLDEVWAGLAKAQRGALDRVGSLASSDVRGWPCGHRLAPSWTAIEDARLATIGYDANGRPWACATPLGRAVLKRAKEQGR